MRIKRKPVDLSQVRPDVLLLGARDAANRLGVPIDELAHLLPPADQVIGGCRFWFAATLDAMTKPRRPTFGRSKAVRGLDQFDTPPIALAPLVFQKFACARPNEWPISCALRSTPSP